VEIALKFVGSLSCVSHGIRIRKRELKTWVSFAYAMRGMLWHLARVARRETLGKIARPRGAQNFATSSRT